MNLQPEKTVLQGIQDAAVDAACPMSTLLRRCAVLAARLNNAELKSWVANELNGYASNADLPGYRIIPSPAQVNVAGPFGSGYKNLTVPPVVLPKNVRQFAERVYLRQSIAALENLAQNAGQGEFTCPWPGDLIVLVQNEGKFAPNLVIYGAWQSVSKAQLVGLVDAVRNRVLEFVLQLENEAPAAGDPEKPGSGVAAEKVTHLFQTIIHGDVVGNVATGSNAVQSTGAVTIQEGDLEGLMKLLATWGISKPDREELQTALKEDPEAPTVGERPKTSGWLAKIFQKSLSGSIKLANGVSVDLVAQVIGQFCGVGKIPPFI